MMGCSYSTADVFPEILIAKQHKQSAFDTKLVSSCRSAVDSTMHMSSSQATSIQDLPPLLLAQIFSKHLNWEDLFGSVPLVCHQFHEVVQHVAPVSLNFEFDLSQSADGTSNGSGGSTSAGAAPANPKSLLQSLLHAPHRLLLRALGSRQQQEEQADDHADQQQVGHAGDFAGQAQDAGDEEGEGGELQVLDEPWAEWLQQRGSRLQSFAMSIANLDSNCAAAQCQVKESLLRALADSASPAPVVAATSAPLVPSSSPSSTNGSTDDLLKVAMYPGGDNTSNTTTSSGGESCTPSQPGSPLSSTGTAFDDANDDKSSTSSTSSTNSDNSSVASRASFASGSSGSSSSSMLETLQLKALHLKVPLFEYDVLLLANDICSKAPELRSLSLVGYSTSGAIKSRVKQPGSNGSTGGGSNVSSLAAFCDGGSVCKTSRRRLPLGRSKGSRCGSSRDAAAGSWGADEGGSQQQPVRHASWRTSRSSGSGRGGFITGSSLKQLMASLPQLTSLTFACRQLYKLSWLQPATQLTYLSLRECSLGPELLKELAGLKMPKLRGLDLSGSRGLGGPDAAAHLQLLSKVAGGALEQLDISGWDLGGITGASRALPQLASLQQLQQLKLECCGLRGWEVEAGQLPNLTSLALSGNALDSQGVAAACGITTLCRLELDGVAPKELALLLLPQPPAGLAQGQGPVCWSGMQPMAHLTSLSLGGNYWPDHSLPDRSPLPPFRAFRHGLCAALAGMPRLARLDLSDCKVPYKGLPLLLGSLPGSVTEVVLDRSADGLRTADIEALDCLPRLRVLSVSGCNIRDKHASALGELSTLHRLVARDNALGPGGVLTVVQSCSQLSLLDVGGNERLSSLSSSGNNSSQCSKCTECVSLNEALLHTRGPLLYVRD